jgi:hypothetical protein
MSKILNSRLKVTFAYRSPVVSNRQTPDSTTGRHGFARFLCHPFLASWSGAREVGQDHGGTWGWEIFRRIFRRIWEVIFGGYSMKNGDWMYFNMVRWDWMGVWWDSFHKPWLYIRVWLVLGKPQFVAIFCFTYFNREPLVGCTPFQTNIPHQSESKLQAPKGESFDPQEASLS